MNNPINLVDPDGTSVEDGPHYLASTYVGGDGKIIKHINDGDKNIYFVPDASKWNRERQNLSIIGRERKGVNYNEYVGRSLSQTPFDRTRVQLRGENQKEQLSLMVGVLSRFGPQGISQSFALDGLLSPHLSAYLAFINILELIGDSRITLSKGTDGYADLTGFQIISKFKKGGIREVFPEEYNDETWEVIGKEANRGC